MSPSPTAARTRDISSILDAISSGRTTAAALVERSIERIGAVNDQLNLVAWPTFERARAQAALPRTGPLSGVPTMIKDTLPEAGLPLCLGSTALRGHIAESDGPYTRAMIDAGLISIARSSMPEFGLNVVTESPLVGVTRNPWSLDHSPGGSSGGGAAAVAAGVVPVAHASDGLGSIRHGAAPCGLVGLKVSRGRNVGDTAPQALVDLGVNGCVSRTVRDTALWLHATQAPDGQGSFAPVPIVSDPVAQPLRIHAYARTMRTGQDPDTSVLRVYHDTIDLLGQLGHSVSDGRLPFDGPDTIRSLHDFIEGNFQRQVAALAEATKTPIPPDAIEYRSATLIAAGQSIDDVQMAAAVSRMQGVAAAYLESFSEFDIWMTPTFSTEIVRHGVFNPAGAWLDQRDHLVDYAGYCWIDNFAGTPAISLPLGFSKDGLPVGIQFASRPGTEPLLLALAYQLERALDWVQYKPPIWVGEE